MQFINNNLKSAWEGIKSVIGIKKKKQDVNVIDCAGFANEQNTFYSRFDNQDFSEEIEEMYSSLPESVGLIITNDDVLRTFKQLNVRKSCGPDNLPGIVLKECGEQLCSIFQKLFQWSVNSYQIPTIWKTSNIIPVPKKAGPSVLNDYRPVALTSIVMKCLERIVKKLLFEDVSHLMDQLQFAYRPGRGTEDATMTLLHNVYSHLDSCNNYVRILFVDFSSAFNTIQPHLLMNKLLQLGVNTNIIKWVKEFMVNRFQYVSVNCKQSSLATVSTGAPQGCVLSPILFTLYTNDCSCSSNDVFTVKYADDAALTGLISKSELNYRNEISNFVSWCKENFLFLNVKKTKELIIDFRKKKEPVKPTMIDNEEIEIVDHYKYLGTIIDSKLTFNQNTDLIYKKGQQRLYFLRTLRNFSVDKTIMSLFYRTFIQSILSFNFLCWYEGLSLRNKNKLSKIVAIANKIAGTYFESISNIYERQTVKKVNKIIMDSSHPFSSYYEPLPSGRRLRLPSFRTNRARSSFIPSSIRVYNKYFD